jgi:GAF domain-containing protein
MLGLYTFIAVLVPQVEGRTLLQALIEFGSITETTLLFIGLYIFAIIGIVAVRRGALATGGVMTLAAWYAGGIGTWLYAPDALLFIATPLLIFTLLAALLFQQRGILTGLLVSALTVILAIVMHRDVPVNMSIFLIITVWLLSGALVLAFTVRFFRISLTEGVSEALEERVKGNEIIASVTQELAEHTPSARIVWQIAHDVVAAFDYITRARVYLIDESGLESRLMVDTAQIDADPNAPIPFTIRASLTGMSSIAQVMQSGRPHIAPMDANQIEAVFPLRIGDRVLGALDILSDNPRAFNRPDVVDALQALSDNAALVIDNASQFERAESRLKENQHLVEELQTTLRERERLTQRLTGSAWTQYIRNAPGSIGLTVDFEGNQGEGWSEEEWTSTLAEAIKINSFIQDQVDGRQVVSMPLRVRGQVIGAMEFELDENRQFSPEDLELLQEVGERFGLAADNTRLVQESQRVAQREALVNQISARLQTTNNVQGTLSEAARGLQDAFKASKVVIRLGQSAENGGGASGGGGNRNPGGKS